VDVPALNGRVRFMNYEALLPESGSDLDARIQDLMSRSSVPVVRLKKGKERTLDLKDYLFSMGSSDDRTLVFTIALKGEEGSARPQEVLQALLGSDGDVLADVRLTRTSLTFSMEQDKAGGRPGWARIWD
jgi:hypothetical protein